MDLQFTENVIVDFFLIHILKSPKVGIGPFGKLNYPSDPPPSWEMFWLRSHVNFTLIYYARFLEFLAFGFFNIAGLVIKTVKWVFFFLIFFLMSVTTFFHHALLMLLTNLPLSLLLRKYLKAWYFCRCLITFTRTCQFDDGTVKLENEKKNPTNRLKRIHFHVPAKRL